MSVPTTPCKPGALGVFRHSDSAPTVGLRSFANMAALSSNEPREHTKSQQGFHRGPTPPSSPTKRQGSSEGFPCLPPPPPARSSSSSSTHHSRSSSGFIKRSDSHLDAVVHNRGSHGEIAQHQRGSRGSQGEIAQQSSVVASAQYSDPAPHPAPHQGLARRSSQEDSAPGLASKPPMPVGARVVAAGPAYGNLVARVQKGEYRQTQARSMYLASDKPFLQAASSFGPVSTDNSNSNGRRPLSLV
jgi:hypothetical protein